MTQHNDILHLPIRYTRLDFTALRAWLSGISLSIILDRYYPVDEIANLFPNGETDLGKTLSMMRDDLIARMVDANPGVAESMAWFRGHHHWDKKILGYLCEAADAKSTLPYPPDPITVWFKPIAAKRLKADGIKTLAELINAIEQRGKKWYIPIPCMGPGKAKRIEAWLLSHKDTLSPLPYFIGQPDVPALPATVKVLERYSRTLMPMERFLPASELSGEHGCNRHHQFPLISARNDYDAVQAYLYKYRGQEKTWRSYRKEIERFIVWCICERGKAMSDLMVDDCEAYKDFLIALPKHWVGKRTSRKSQHWKPFSSPTLSSETQCYAIQCLRACFAWLVDVRYLAANPFVAVPNPGTARQIHKMQIHKALPKALWEKLSRRGGILDEVCAMSEEDLKVRYPELRYFRPVSRTVRSNPDTSYLPQVRVLRAMILLLGATGIRREELAFASRKNLNTYPNQPGIWQLAVLGKRAKWRYVYPTVREIEAIKEHWADRGEEFDVPRDIPLLSPVVFPATAASQDKHLSDDDNSGKGYSVDHIYRLVRSWLIRFANDDALDLTTDERDMLAHAGIHAFRHTFGTLAVADNMPLDVVQGQLGHASLNTTTTYVRSTEERAAAEIRRWRAAS